MSESKNPYKGITTYSKVDKDKFYGRTKEVENIVNAIENNYVTTIFGKSGLGKSSLLRAGVFPKLEEKNYLPVFINKFIYEKKNIYQKIKDAIEETDKKIEVREESEILKSLSKNYPEQKVVIILDQFEEYFQDKNDDLYEKIEQLYNNLPVIGNYRLIFSLREDYLGPLEDLADKLPELRRNRHRIHPLTKEQAKEVILTGNSQNCPFEKEENALTILDIVTDNILTWQDLISKFTEPQSTMVDPLLLSVYLETLWNETKKEKGEENEEIFIDSAQFFGDTNKLKDIYEKSIKEKLYETPLKSFTTEQKIVLIPQLLLSKEIKNHIYQKYFDDFDPLITEKDINFLIEKRLLIKRTENYLELSHDRLIVFTAEDWEKYTEIFEKRKNYKIKENNTSKDFVSDLEELNNANRNSYNLYYFTEDNKSNFLYEINEQFKKYKINFYPQEYSDEQTISDKDIIVVSNISIQKIISGNNKRFRNIIILPLLTPVSKDDSEYLNAMKKSSENVCDLMVSDGMPDDTINNAFRNFIAKLPIQKIINEPHEIDHYVERPDELSEISRKLEQKDFLIIKGKAFTGKKTICYEYIKNNKLQYPGTIFWFNCHANLFGSVYPIKDFYNKTYHSFSEALTQDNPTDKDKEDNFWNNFKIIENIDGDNETTTLQSIGIFVDCDIKLIRHIIEEKEKRKLYAKFIFTNSKEIEDLENEVLSKAENLIISQPASSIVHKITAKILDQTEKDQLAISEEKKYNSLFLAVIDASAKKLFKNDYIGIVNSNKDESEELIFEKFLDKLNIKKDIERLFGEAQNALIGGSIDLSNEENRLIKLIYILKNLNILASIDNNSNEFYFHFKTISEMEKIFTKSEYLKEISAKFQKEHPFFKGQLLNILHEERGSKENDISNEIEQEHLEKVVSKNIFSELHEKSFNNEKIISTANLETLLEKLGVTDINDEPALKEFIKEKGDGMVVSSYFDDYLKYLEQQSTKTETLIYWGVYKYRFQERISFYKKARNTIETIMNELVPMTKKNVPLYILTDWADILIKTGNLRLAQKIYLYLIHRNENKNQSKNEIVGLYRNYSDALREVLEYSKADKLLTRSQTLIQEDEFFTGVLYGDLASIYLRMGKYHDAFESSVHSYKVLKKKEFSPNHIYYWYEKARMINTLCQLFLFAPSEDIPWPENWRDKIKKYLGINIQNKELLNLNHLLNLQHVCIRKFVETFPENHYYIALAKLNYMEFIMLCRLKRILLDESIVDTKSYFINKPDSFNHCLTPSEEILTLSILALNSFPSSINADYLNKAQSKFEEYSQDEAVQLSEAYTIYYQLAHVLNKTKQDDDLKNVLKKLIDKTCNENQKWQWISKNFNNLKIK